MIARTEIGGVPVLHGPSTGPARAGLVFRVGFADEPMARRGITHLIEHLALSPLGLADFHYNGSTGTEYTSFHMTGTPGELAGFVDGVCTALHDLPMHRLDTEKDILRAEAHSRSHSAHEPLALWRHGARDHGAVAYPEWGVSAITPDDLRYWAARYFTRDNAVLWVAGDEVPAELRLHLPSGTRQPSPAPSSALPVTPACFAGPEGVVGWSGMVPYGPAAIVFADVLERAMIRTLRQEAGLSYAAHTDYHPMGTDTALVTALADCLPDKQGAVLGAFVDELAALRVGRIDPADVQAVIRKRHEALVLADQQGDRLAGHARALLAGRPVPSIETELALLAAVTPQDVTAMAQQAAGTGLLMTPPGTAGTWAGFTAAPAESDTVVIGTPYAAVSEPDTHLIVAVDGVSLVSGNHRATVRFDACAIVRAWPHGGRTFVGHDGIVVSVEPTLYRDGHQAVAWLDTHCPAALRVDEAPRDPGAIPRPDPAPAYATEPPIREERRQVRAMSVLVTIFLISGVIRGFILVRDEFHDNGTTAGLITAAAVVAVIGGSLLWRYRGRFLA
ncbi:peptidase M16 family protein [Couchioplanes caeruleus]|uniref:Peptidase n=2 Tax=Couchioplanes caeruleus TaxID=56438 RepID=A0A1K0G333_9ACTN|nr:insulinase family protein [Couchioplanes caeruleus]OJF11698.1 peptidase [Couchioplanes caeruleus subsp. caeruleus]ROP33003.1 putative Zn-dependent peptidase [Couchioplanes caeruleus]